MDLKILVLIIMYYAVFSIVFFFGGAAMFGDAGYSLTADLNSTAIGAGELDTGGLFGTGVSFGRFAAIVVFGLGLPSDTPAWFAVMFAMWQTCVTIFIIGWVINSIWGG